MWEKIPQINTYYSAQAFESFGVGGWGWGCQNSSDGITHIYFFHNFDTKIGVSSFRRGVSKAQWAVSGLVAPLSGASSGVVVALAVAGVDAQEVAQVVEQKNFQHGLVVSESESSVIYKVTFTKATSIYVAFCRFPTTLDIKICTLLPTEPP